MNKVKFNHSYRNAPRQLFYGEGEIHDLTPEIYAYIKADSHGAFSEIEDVGKAAESTDDKPKNKAISRSKVTK